MPAALHEHLPRVKIPDAPAKLEPSTASRFNDNAPRRGLIQCAQKSRDLALQFAVVRRDCHGASPLIELPQQRKPRECGIQVFEFACVHFACRAGATALSILVRRDFPQPRSEDAKSCNPL
jgi:hypothetical protein